MNTAKTAFMVMATIILTALSWAPLSAEQDRGRFEVEIFGGLSLINPADLNLRPQFDHNYDHLFIDDYYNFLVSVGKYDAVSKLRQGEVRVISAPSGTADGFLVALPRPQAVPDAF